MAAADTPPGEASTVAQSGHGPVTVDSLVTDLRALGVPAGGTVLVHTSMSALGWVCGAAQAVVEALIATLGEGGTLVMPAFSAHLTDPAHWRHPPVPESWWPTIRASMPAFDALLTPTRQIGSVADTFRRAPGALRSAHPHDSFAARGPAAASLLAEHPLEEGFGDRSPLGRLYAADASILLLGVGHGNNSSLHLAEHRARWPGRRIVEQGAPLLVDGRRRWVAFPAPFYDSDDFGQLGQDLERETDVVRQEKVGAAAARFMRMRPLVDYGVRWLERTRGAAARVPT
jgi:aminoglycoside 3-N-acetyltransferase